MTFPIYGKNVPNHQPVILYRYLFDMVMLLPNSTSITRMRHSHHFFILCCCETASLRRWKELPMEIIRQASYCCHQPWDKVSPFKSFKKRVFCTGSSTNGWVLSIARLPCVYHFIVDSCWFTYSKRCFSIAIVICQSVDCGQRIEQLHQRFVLTCDRPMDFLQSNIFHGTLFRGYWIFLI